jgi:hypothetical protein
LSTLIDEISQAVEDLRTAEEETTAASKQLRQCKSRLKECRAELSRLILELKTGESRYPLIERFTATGESVSPNGDAIETDLARVLEAGPDADGEPDVNIEWTSADLERELRDAVTRVGSDSPTKVWAGPKRKGCDDAKILEILRSIWPAGYLAREGTGPWEGRNVGKTIHGGPTPAFWIGARKAADWKVAPPQLQGLRLADRVRSVLGIRRPGEAAISK